MTMQRWDGVAYTDLATFKRWDGVAWVDLTIAKRWNGTAWMDIAFPGGGGGGGLSATANKGNVGATYHDVSVHPPNTRNMTTDSVTITPVGGTGPGPTISWAKLSGANGITATSPTGFVTGFTANVNLNVPKTAVWRATVVRGAETVFVDILVQFDYDGGIIP